jgi:hypothetical protein
MVLLIVAKWGKPGAVCYLSVRLLVELLMKLLLSCYSSR